ncbi:MAG TPA: DUF3597 domain-containing protein [Steroidobacteraceae bacterium]|nr:DUF3597 domain-containing protein [Steroidobacteraceae bacterium]
MSIFGRILEKLGIGKDDDKNKGRTPPASSTQAQAGRPSVAPTQTTPHTSSPGAQRTAPPPSPQQAQAARPAQAQQPRAMSETDVVAKLEKLAADNPQKLNWRTSIVDLMKLLGMESSLAERKELAAELGYPRDQMDDSAKMNVWLHKQVLRKIAENGGNVPKELLD